MKITTLSLLALCSATLISCNPDSYIVDTRPYVSEIASNPEAVEIEPEHVKPQGGSFQLTDVAVGTTIRTDIGEITVTEDGISSNLVVDLTSGK